MFIYVCHKGNRFLENNFEYDFHSDEYKQYFAAKHLKYKLVVKVICPNDAGQDIEIFVNSNITSHEPRSKDNVFFLLLHQSAIDNCVEMLNSLNKIQLAISHLERCKNILHEKVPLHKQQTYHFFFITKKHQIFPVDSKCNKDVVKTIMMQSKK